jgi:transposase
MQQRLPFVPHLTASEVRRRYLSCERAGERTRWHALWLLADGWPARTPDDVAALVGRSGAFVRSVLKRFNASGPPGLADGRCRNRSAGLLSGTQRAELLAALKGDPPDGGLWSGPKVAAFARGRFGVSVRPQTGWDWLRRLGFSLKVPRPRHPKAAGEEAQRRWVQRLSDRVAGLRRDNPGKRVEVWVQDEARLGLKPVVRRVWALKGQRPRSNGRQRFGAVYVYGFAEPLTGRNRCLVLPKANAEHMGRALADFAAWADPAGGKVMVLLVDNAGWHVAKRLEVPPNVLLHHLPACTPELQPAERLWPLVREGLANKTFDDLPALEAKLISRLAVIEKATDQVQAVLGYHWALAL